MKGFSDLAQNFFRVWRSSSRTGRSDLDQIDVLVSHNRLQVDEVVHAIAAGPAQAEKLYRGRLNF
jgi:hypothetical protein